MLFNPMLRLSAMVVKTFIKKADLPSAFIGLTVNFFSVSRSLIKTFGLFPTLEAVRYIQYHLLKGTPAGALPVTSIPDFILNPLLSVVRINWPACLENIDKMSKYFWIMPLRGVYLFQLSTS